MPKKQYTLQGNYKPWYVGWRICHQKASEVLQKFYDTPSFMPKDWKLNKTEWIFMGTPGVGAPFHLDNVQASSWQAQVPDLGISIDLKSADKELKVVTPEKIKTCVTTFTK